MYARLNSALEKAVGCEYLEGGTDSDVYNLAGAGKEEER